MNEINFDEIKNFEVPESWIENALNIPSKNNKPAMPIKLYRFAAGIAACVVIAVAVMFSMLFGINKNINLIDPQPDPSQADNISGGAYQSTTDAIGASPEIPPVFSAEDNQTATAVTEPPEGGTNDNSKSTRQGSSSANGRSKAQTSGGTNSNSANGKQKQGSPNTQPYSGENASQAPNVQEPTDNDPEPFNDSTNEPWEETDEPTWLAPPSEFNYTLTATVESSLAQGDIYCRVTDKNGITFGIGGLFDKTRLVYKYDAGGGNTSLEFDAYNRPAYYGRMEFGESYNVIFYNAKGETIRQGWVTVYYDEYYSV